MNAPQGIGLYLGRVARTWSTGERVAHANRVLRAKVRHVALCVEGIGRDKSGSLVPQFADLGILEAAADVYRGIAGVSVSVYSLVSPARVGAPLDVAARLRTAADRVEAAHEIVDAEEAFRGHGAELRALLAAARAGLPAGRGLGITTYGRPSAGGSYPWAPLVSCDWIGWQEYETAARRSSSRAGLGELRSFMGGEGRVVPHLASYERKAPTTPLEGLDGAARLRADLERSCIADDGRIDVPGVWIWQDATLDEGEADVLADFSRRAGWC